MGKTDEKTLKRVFAYKIAGLYPMYVKKAERKGRTKQEVDEVICWLTGYKQAQLEAQLASDNDVETFLNQSPAFNPNSSLITGVVCGVRVEEIEDPTYQKLRYLDKLVDELAKGRSMEKILRK